MAAFLITSILLAPFLGLPLVVAASRWRRKACAWSAALVFLFGLCALAPMGPAIVDAGMLVVEWPWLAHWGLNLALRLDGLSFMFLLLILGIGLLIVLYAAYYLDAADRLGRFYALLLAFAGGMIGIVLSENILLMLVFWEITSLTSFLLIAYKYETHETRIAARMALAVTGGGGLALLAGLLLLGHIAESFALSDILARGDQIRAHAAYPATLILILLGIFTKSAQFPFHFWLPNAMAAPTPVSAYLHSATMVKAGVFLLARLYPALSGTELWFLLVGGAGAVTFVFGAYLALLKHDIKGLLAYSTISHLGLITLLFGLNTPMSAVAAVFHIINHAIFKASLFMAAGVIDHECGIRDMRRINGLFKYMPWTGSLAIVAAASMAGVPLLNGFLSKEMFFTEAIAHPAFQGWAGYLLPAFATVAGALSVAYSARFVHDVFFNGEPVDLPRTPHEAPGWMRLPIDILVALVLLVGLLPQFSIGPLLKAASAAVLPGGVPSFHLAIWHGFNPPLVMSAAALGIGLLYYRRRERLFRLHERFLLRVTSPVAFERAYNAMHYGALRLMARIDRQSLQTYLALFVGFTILLAGGAWLGSSSTALAGPVATAPGFAAAAAFGALCVGVFGTALHHRRRFIAVIFMSVVGLIVALTFVRFEAPDLALTQVSIEVVTIVLLLLSLRFLPGEAAPGEARARKLRHAGLAGVAGLGVSALCYAMLTRPFETISGYHIANALPGGGGTNVVNVILVDFRGFDTLGEITVLAMAALGLHALVERLRLRPMAFGTGSSLDKHPIMLAMLMRPLLPLALAVSVYIFLRGHNLPGGGFIAGLVAGVALMLQYLASGIEYASERLRADYARFLGAGLAIAMVTGLASWLFSYPFLTGAYAYVDPPVIEKFEIASAMAFDLGVYIVVVAAVLLVLTELGKLSQRESRPAASGEG